MKNGQTAGDLMTGKRGLVMGVANERSIAWGIAKTLAEHGASLAFTYQTEALKKRVEPLAASLSAPSPTTVRATPKSVRRAIPSTPTRMF